MKRTDLGLQEWAGILAIAGVMVASAVVTTINTRELAEDSRWVAHTLEVKSITADLSATVISAQNSNRGFLIAGTEDLRSKFQQECNGVVERTAKLRLLVSDNEPQQMRVDTMQLATRALLRVFNQRVSQRESKGIGSFLPADIAEGERAMDHVRGVLARITQEEDGLLHGREQRRSHTQLLALITSLAAGLVSLLVLAFFTRNLLRANAVRAQNAAALFEREQWFSTTLGSIGDAVIATDPQGRVNYMNSIAEDLTGWQRTDASGKTLLEVFPIVNEDTRAPVEDPVAKVLATGKIAGLANHTVLISKDGTERPIDDSAAPIRDSAGNLVGVVLVFHDVGPQRKVDRELRRSEARKGAILETSLDCVVTINHLGKVLEFNPAAEQTFGYTALEAVGREMAELIVPPAYREAHRKGMAHYLTTGHGPVLNKRIEIVAMRADGTEFPVELAITPIPDQEAPIFTGHLRDITERKRMESDLRETAARLSEADRRKSEFIAILAHELRNPLAPLRNSLELIKVAEGDPEHIKVVMPIMERQLGQMVRLVDDLLDVTRISHGKIELRKVDADLADLLRQAEEVARVHCEQAGQHLKVELATEPLHVQADPARLVQVFGNLLNNASKFTPHGGSISITLVREGGKAVVRIVDNGIGIDADHQSRIFNLFTQVDDTLERTQGGLGIGLTLVRWLVEMHGGSVLVHSHGVGKGSEFVITLPLVRAPKPALPEENTAVPAATRQRRVLVVDDNQDAAQSIAMLLRKHKHEVFVAYDGLEALHVAAEVLPDAVLLDIGMPGLNGYEAAERMRTIPGMEKALFIALTGWGQEENRKRTAAAGFDEHLVKPADNRKLMELLQRPDQGVADTLGK